MKTKAFILLFAAVIIMSSFGSKNTTDKALNAGILIQTPLVASGMMITAKLKIKPEKIKDFLMVAKEMIEKSNKESGWDQSAVDAHFATDYFKAFGPKIAGLVQEPAKIKVITVANVTEK